MSQQDKQKWNEKFTKKSELLQPREASVHVQQYTNQCEGKKALDLACGAGRHALYLAQKGFEVEALDISDVAVDALRKVATKENLLSLHVKVFDLDEFVTTEPTYDFIVMSNYLDRDLITKASMALHVKGIFVIETYMDDESNEKKDSNTDNLLKPKELIDFFDNSYEVLLYDEFDNESYELYRMKKQVVVVQKKQ